MVSPRSWRPGRALFANRPLIFVRPVLYRFACVAVVIFWAVMTLLLVRSSYFSSEDRLPVVDTDFVVDRFVNNANRSNLTVYKGRRPVGRIALSPRRLDDGRVDLLMTALGEIEIPGVGKQDLAWRGNLILNGRNEVDHLAVNVKFRDPDVRVWLEVDPATFEISYRVEHDGETVVDSDDRKSKAVRRVKLLLAAWGLGPKALQRKAEQRESSRQQVVARHGKVEIGGEKMNAYLLEVTPLRGKKFRLYFNDAGELMKVGSLLGYEILSDAFDDDARIPVGNGG